ncbi:hypothetical protein KUCAC02_030360 [Chaenocephalus aceratus]|uniref:Uncharacterized protein n=1 Tax=Chaenocephalus aceratus TaxID=36190 RepID=A0ACB9XIH9_CHAAC|nr:hypothetical protein KUCAC02_030360 [Chaenocephalus aceratus]
MVTSRTLKKTPQQHEQPNVPDCTEQTDGHPDQTAPSQTTSVYTTGMKILQFIRARLPSSNLPPSSPCSSPVLAKRPPGSPSPGSYQSPLPGRDQQRFHAARHKFPRTIDPEPQTQAAQPALPPLAKGRPPSYKQSPPRSQPGEADARSTVTNRSCPRFTTGQQNAAPKKSASPNNSPFGTTTGAWLRPCLRSSRRAAGALQQGIRSPPSPGPTGANPPPIPPKKPSLAQAPPPPRPQCPGLPDTSLTPPSQAAAASLPARRESKNWTWWCLPTNGSFDSSVKLVRCCFARDMMV